MSIQKSISLTLLALAGIASAESAKPVATTAPAVAPATSPAKPVAAVAAPAAKPAAVVAPAAAPAAKPAAAAVTAPAVKPAAVVAPVAAPAAKPAVVVPSKFASDKDKFSYTIGLDIGESIKRTDFPLNLAMIYQGLTEAMAGDSTKYLLTADERKETMMLLTAEIQKAMAVKDSIAAAAGVEKAKAFFAKNKTVKGVITTASGLQYTVITKGKGPSPKAGSEVTAHYVGTLLDGTEFDSSVKRGQPATFTLDRVIKGWQEMLPLMNVGEKVKCWIPSELGYGPRASGAIPANSLLTFEIELISFPAEAPALDPKAAAPVKAAPAVAAAKPAAVVAPAKTAPVAAPAAAPVAAPAKSK